MKATKSNSRTPKPLDPNAILDQIMAVEADGRSGSIPPGWHKSSYWQQHWGISNCQALSYLRKGIKHGIIEKQKFHGPDDPRPIPYYRQKA